MSIKTYSITRPLTDDDISNYTVGKLMARKSRLEHELALELVSFAIRDGMVHVEMYEDIQTMTCKVHAVMHVGKLEELTGHVMVEPKTCDPFINESMISADHTRIRRF
jgi:hypothetical protein